jgi:hypothetical protein
MLLYALLKRLASIDYLRCEIERTITIEEPVPASDGVICLSTVRALDRAHLLTHAGLELVAIAAENAPWKQWD